ncbi:hypothetical protein UlMin_021863 [Ulmus minor]
MDMADRSDSDDVRSEENPNAGLLEESSDEEEWLEDDDHKSPTYQSPSKTSKKPSSEQNPTVPAPAQLTIFYGGSIKVFDGLSEDKVNEIIRIATAAAAAAAAGNTSAKSGEMKTIGTENSTNSPLASAAMGSLLSQLNPAQKSSLTKLQAEFPIARRLSLQRFFEKRRDRLVSKNPYPSSPAMKVEKMENETKTS